MLKKFFHSLPLLIAAPLTHADVMTMGTNYSDPYYYYFYGALQSSANFGSPGAIAPNRSFNILNADTNFSSSYLGNLDIFMASSKSNFSISQANDLYNYVLGGGNLFVYSDYADANNANTVASLFGVHFQNSWVLSGFQVQPVSNIVTNGPFAVGSVGTYDANAISYIDSLGDYATSIAQISPTTINTAFIGANILAPGAGAVLFYSDWVANTFTSHHSNNTNRNMILNFFANVSADTATPIPEPSPLLLCSAALFALTRINPSRNNLKALSIPKF